MFAIHLSLGHFTHTHTALCTHVHTKFVNQMSSAFKDSLPPAPPPVYYFVCGSPLFCLIKQRGSGSVVFDIEIDQGLEDAGKRAE